MSSKRQNVTPGNILVTNHSDNTTVIDIEGIIGIPESLQFDQPEKKIATYETFHSTLRVISSLQNKNITVNIRSTGGDVNDALLIYDSLTESGAQITTRCYGYVASAATIIAQAATEGRREISANCLYLIHNSESEGRGNRNEMQRTMELLSRTDERIAGIYSSRSGLDTDSFDKIMSENDGKGRWLTPHETIALGLADRIIDPSPIKKETTLAVACAGLPPIPGLPDYSGHKKTGIFRQLGKLLSSVPEHITEASSSAPQKKPKSESTAGSSVIHDVEKLRDQIGSIESDIKRQAARPTSTKPKEDPSVHEFRQGVNEIAYQNDAMRIKNHTH